MESDQCIKFTVIWKIKVCEIVRNGVSLSKLIALKGYAIMNNYPKCVANETGSSWKKPSFQNNNNNNNLKIMRTVNGCAKIHSSFTSWIIDVLTKYLLVIKSICNTIKNVVFCLALPLPSLPLRSAFYTP